jgi:Zn-dependent M16 (insulinase) family peptidase
LIATDHTAYTVTSVGKDGFMQVLGVYMDHVLFPTLTDHGFVREVYHIPGTGVDAGVVYSEMQAIENTAQNKCFREVMKKLYPGEECGYNKETGGMLHAIRKLTNKTIQDFHQKFYRSQKLCVIVTGDIHGEDVLAELDRYLPRLCKQTESFNYPKAWSSNVPAFNHSDQIVVDFPSDDETYGHHFLGWRACPWSDFETRDALEIVLRYLTDSPIAPLQKALVEIEEPLCGRIDVD